MDYYNDYCVSTLVKLESLIDNDGVINQDIRVMGDLKSLGRVKKVKGHLNLDDNIEDLGDLNFIKTDLWCNSETSLLKTLGKLERVDGDINLRYSNIESLGNLNVVGGKLTLRDTKITDLGNLKFVGGDLYLPARFKDIELSEIEVKGKIRFWNNIGESKNSKLTQDNKWYVTDYFSNIHQREIESKKRCLDSNFLVKRCYMPNELNGYTTDNINDFFNFVDLKLIELYRDKYSFFDVIFNEVKSIEEINNEFPQIKIDKRKSSFKEEARKKSTQTIYRLKKNTHLLNITML
jgi:hypothetical protein